MRKRIVKALPFYSRFIGGETIECVQEEVKKLKQNGFFPIIDNALEHDETQITRMQKETEQSIIALPGDYIAIKLTCLGMDDLSPIYRICDIAKQHNTPLLIDAEQIALQDTIDSITDKLILKYNKEYPLIHKTYQMYRCDRLSLIKQDIENFMHRDVIHGFKIVRGAYLSEEINLGNQKYLCKNIDETHKNYNAGVDLLLSSINSYGIIATHNRDSCERLTDNGRIKVAQLKGMGDSLSYELKDKSFTVLKYMPWGPFMECVPYLTRRLYENYDILKHL